MCNMYVWLNITPFFRCGTVLQPNANEVSVEEICGYKAHIKGETDICILNQAEHYMIWKQRTMAITKSVLSLTT